jgi:hypothetical protein
METVLLAITVVSLVAALVMSFTAWRVARENRARSAARVAALVAAASEDRREMPPAVERTTPHASVVNDARRAPWKPSQPQPRHLKSRSQDRHPLEREERLMGHAGDVDPADGVGESFLGSAVARPASSNRQRGLALAACALFVALVTVGYVSIFGDDADSVGVVASEPAASPAPLELISLGHQRKSSALAITGLVRNPSQAQPVEQLAAVAFLFDQQGRLLTSARADVDFKQLAPGDESPFVITLDAPANVARYRVSFRNDAGVVPHVDRRGQEPIARDLP